MIMVLCTTLFKIFNQSSIVIKCLNRDTEVRQEFKDKNDLKVKTSYIENLTDKIELTKRETTLNRGLYLTTILLKKQKPQERMIKQN